MNNNNNNNGLVVLGMHRSGTSCLAGMLQFAGFNAGMIDEWNPDNLKGNRENQSILKLNSAIFKESGGSWHSPPSSVINNPVHYELRDEILTSLQSSEKAWMFKEPRTLFTLPFWLNSSIKFKLIGIFRDPMSVAKSLNARDNLTITEGLKLWAVYNENLLRVVREHNVPLLYFTDDPESFQNATSKAIANLFPDEIEKGSLKLNNMRSFFASELVHHHSSDNSDFSHELKQYNLTEKEQLWIQKLWDGLVDRATTPPHVGANTTTMFTPSLQNAVEQPVKSTVIAENEKEPDFNTQLEQLNKDIEKSSIKTPMWRRGVELHNKFDQNDILLKWVKLWANRCPNEPFLSFELAKASWANGFQEAAISAAENCIRLAPGWLPPMKQLAKWYFDIQLWEKAARISATLLQYEGFSPPAVKSLNSQLFFDQGDGYNEKQSVQLSVPAMIKDFTGIFTLPDPEKIKTLRLDPLNEPIILNLIKISYIDKNENETEAFVSHSNAEHKEGPIYYFGNNDPQIHFNKISSLKEKPHKLMIAFEILKKGSEATQACLAKLTKCNVAQLVNMTDPIQYDMDGTELPLLLYNWKISSHVSNENQQTKTTDLKGNFEIGIRQPVKLAVRYDGSTRIYDFDNQHTLTNKDSKQEADQTDSFSRVTFCRSVPKECIIRVGIEHDMNIYWLSNIQT